MNCAESANALDPTFFIIVFFLNFRVFNFEILANQSPTFNSLMRKTITEAHFCFKPRLTCTQISIRQLNKREYIHRTSSVGWVPSGDQSVTMLRET